MPTLPQQHGLKWVFEMYDVETAWTVEPDMSVAKSLAQPHLPDGPYTISFFASGGFNRLYLLSPANPSLTLHDYIMRVTLPVDPHFKTASEVATLSYIRRYTTIPVPQVIAYDASANNDLGFEWILMSRLEGVALRNLWTSPTLTWEHRLQVTKTVAGYVKQLQGRRFHTLGSLFLSDQNHPCLHWLQNHSDDTNISHFTPLEHDPDFSIGPVVATPYLYGNRFKLTTERGPFQTSSAWLSSLLDLQIASTNDLSINRPEERGEYSPNDISEFHNTVRAAEALRLVIPTVFPPKKGTEEESYVLCHNDLSLSNILIDPTTHQVTGVVDWERVYLQPEWKAQRHPEFLRGPMIDAERYTSSLNEPFPDIPHPPGWGEGDEGREEVREYLELMLLRAVFDDVVRADSNAELLKRIFEHRVEKVGLLWRWTGNLKWVEHLMRDGSFVPEVEKGLYIWPPC